MHHATGIMRPEITFLPGGQSARVPSGTTIFEAAVWLGLTIESDCGGRGTCGQCKVQLESSSDAPTEADRRFLVPAELAEGWRIACRTAVVSGQIARLPRPSAAPRVAMTGAGRPVALAPNVRKWHLQLPVPDLFDQRSDVQRVLEALKALGVEPGARLPVCRTLSRVLRQSAWDVTAVVAGSHLIAVEPGDTTATCYGVAVDVGTTTVVAMLVDLVRGETVAMAGALNGQAIRGADVLSRISYTMAVSSGATELQERVVSTINGLIDRITGQAGIARETIYEITLTGNATMQHLLLSLDPTAIAMTPFIPATADAVDVEAGEIGLRLHPQARAYVFPCISAYVGGDTVAMLLATDLPRKRGLRLAIDIGTNGEIALGGAERCLVTAGPAGPAFEGAEISCGMRAVPGAIEGVTIGDDVHLQMVGNLAPAGLCGSGLIDAAAALLRRGLLDPGGRLLGRAEVAQHFPPALAARLVASEAGMRAFVLAWPEESATGRPILLTQKDIRALQYAKAAIASGIDALMRTLGVTADQLDEVLLAGAFGSYLNPASARDIGLVPWTPLERIRSVGNAAGEGARMALLSFRERHAAEAIPRRVESIELSARPDFDELYLEALRLPVLETAG